MLSIDDQFRANYKLAFIHQNTQRVYSQSFIYSQNKQFIGLFNNFEERQEIIVYKLADGIWTEYFKYDFKQSVEMKLLCFGNDDNQILMYQPVTNTLQVLKLEQCLENGLQNIKGFVDDYFKFQDQPEEVTMIASRNGKFILIQQKNMDLDLLFEVNQVEIIAQFKTFYGFIYCKIFIDFLNDQFVMEDIQFLLEKTHQLKFYNIKNSEIKKMMFLKVNDFQLFQHTINKQFLNNNQNLIIITYPLGPNPFGSMINITNQKIIRKIKIADKCKPDKILGVLDRNYLIYTNKTYILIDLFNLSKQEFQFEYQWEYSNEILKIAYPQNENTYYFYTKI